MTKKLSVLADDDILFPHPENALDDPDGLLAIGGDLSSPRLLNAYRHAIFPWFSEGEPILWWSPAVRAVIQPDQVHTSKSMAKFLRKTTLTVTINHAFSAVIEACSQPRKTESETWISPVIKHAYKTLHALGHAHSVEIWDGETLVGGLYGVNVGGIFCGESMFHLQSNASKLAFIALSQHFSEHNGVLIDCQMMTPHLQSLGVTSNTRENFLQQINQFKNISIKSNCWNQQRINFTI